MTRYPKAFVKSCTVMVAGALALSACEFTDYISPNPDASKLYSEPYLGLAQLNSVDSRRMSNAEIQALRGRLGDTSSSLAGYSGKLAPQAAGLVLTPPRDIQRLTEEDTKIAVLGENAISALEARQLEADKALGIFGEARDRALAARRQQEAFEAQRAEQLRRIEQANEQLAEATILAPREVDPVPQPQPPSTLADIFQLEEGVETGLGLIYFESGSAAIGPREQVVIKAIADQLKTGGWRINVNGYDSGSLANRTNADRARSLRLSRQRADAVKALLADNGFPEQKITARGFGDQQPVFPEVNEVGVYGNQRVQITGIREETQN